jgi:rhomboid protease GluP
MKPNYLNAVYTNLILERDYEPLRTPEGLIIPGEVFKVLQKHHSGVNFLIELIDGDQLSAAAIGEKLAAARNMLWQAEARQIIHLIEVFVFSSAPDGEKLAMIAGRGDYQESARKYLSLFTVHLGTHDIVRHTDAGLPVDGLDKLLKRFLATSHDEYETLPDLGQILARKAAEYTIEFRAAKSKVTYYLIGINVAVLVLLYVHAFFTGIPYNELLTKGSKISEYIVYGDYWRFITPIFLHAGFIHLLVNSYSLYILGQSVERIFGHAKFLTVYLIAGIMGNIASFSMFHSPGVQGVGASGAIFGLLGAVLYYGLENPKIYKKYFGYNVIATIVLNVIIGFSLAGIIDNFAHLGGLAGGFLTAGIVRVKAPPDRFPSRNLFLVIALLLAALGLLYGFSFWGSAVKIISYH